MLALVYLAFKGKVQEKHTVEIHGGLDFQTVQGIALLLKSRHHVITKRECPPCWTDLAKSPVSRTSESANNSR